ncbi:MAG: hypothetical protein KF785_00815 [Gemmatimonadales bacterium]|nr:hypothetical protein [Gemmatimonadales bacterium]
MRKLVAAAGVVIAAFAFAPRAEAQAFGANLSWGDDSDFGLGARVAFPIGGSVGQKGIRGLATFDYFFPEGYNFWEITGNGVYDIASSGSASPYVGGGLTFARFSPETGPGGSSEIGLNLLGGARFAPMGNVQPFVEARFQIRDGSQFVLSGGVYFGKL